MGGAMDDTKIGARVDCTDRGCEYIGGGDLGWSVLDEDIRWGTRRWNEAWFETGRMNGIRHRVVTYK